MRLRIAKGRGRKVVRAAGEIGPYLKINKKVYKIDFGTGKPGHWFRAAPLSKDGKPGKEKEFALSEDGKTLTYYKNHSNPRVPVSFENIGSKLPVKKPSPAKFKPIMNEPDVKQATQMALKAIGKDKEKAKAFAVALLGDVNALTGANAVQKALGASDWTEDHALISKVSRLLGYDVVTAAAVGASLLKAMGDNSSATKLLQVYIDAYPDLWGDL